MTTFDQDPPELGIYRKAVRMHRAGKSLYELARLDADGSIFLKTDYVDESGINQHSRTTILPDDFDYDRICREHALIKTGDASLNQKKVVNGEWLILSKPPVYRWAMLMETGEVLMKMDPDSEQRFAAGTAEHTDLCQQHNLIKPGDNSVVEVE